MRTLFLFSFTIFSLLSCSNRRYATVSLNKINAERKETAQRFVKTFLEKCQQEDYSSFQDFSISKSFERKIIGDSLAVICGEIAKRNGKVKVLSLSSVHSPLRPKDYIDVFNFKLETEKATAPVYLHLGLLRDKNFIDLPFYFSKDENYYETLRKRYRSRK